MNDFFIKHFESVCSLKLWIWHHHPLLSNWLFSHTHSLKSGATDSKKNSVLAIQHNLIQSTLHTYLNKCLLFHDLVSDVGSFFLIRDAFLLAYLYGLAWFLWYCHLEWSTCSLINTANNYLIPTEKPEERNHLKDKTIFRSLFRSIFDPR